MAYGLLTDKQTEQVIMNFLRNGPRHEKDIERVCKWAHGAAVQAACLEGICSGEVGVDVDERGTILFSVP